jgi:N6-adenosine-specific RNA methylase IME4
LYVAVLLAGVSDALLYMMRCCLLLRRWGFKRCEDICWIKINQQHKKRKYLIPTYQQEGSMLVHTKVGIAASLQTLLSASLTVFTVVNCHLISSTLWQGTARAFL